MVVEQYHELHDENIAENARYELSCNLDYCDIFCLIYA